MFTNYPDISKEWDYKKNGKLTPYDVVWGSHKKVWWKCKRGHSWEAIIKQRSIGYTGCPHCNKIILKDGAVLDSYLDAWYYLKLKENSVHFVYNKRYNKLGRKRFDFYIPEINTYIEITCFMKNYNYGYSSYIKYLKNIVKKRRMVLSMGANFEFIQRKITAKEIKYINSFC